MADEPIVQAVRRPCEEEGGEDHEVESRDARDEADRGEAETDEAEQHIYASDQEAAGFSDGGLIYRHGHLKAKLERGLADSESANSSRWLGDGVPDTTS